MDMMGHTFITVLLSILSVGVEPLDVTVNVPKYVEDGQSATLECNFPFSEISNVLYVYWRGSNATIETSEAATDIVYYDGGKVGGPEIDRVVLNIETFHLTIPHVAWPIDERKYWCIASVRINGNSFDSGVIESITYKPNAETGVTLYHVDGGTDEPLNGSLKVDVDVDYIFKCVVIGAKPAANITWTLGDNHPDGIQIDTKNPDMGHLLDSTSTLSARKIMKMDNKLTCNAKVLGDSEGIEKSVALIYPAPPSVSPPTTTTKKPGKGASGGLSTGPIIGIVVAVIVFCAICIVIIVVVCKKKNENK